MQTYTLRKPDGDQAIVDADTLDDAVNIVNSMGYFFYPSDCRGIKETAARIVELHVKDSKEIYTKISAL